MLRLLITNGTKLLVFRRFCLHVERKENFVIDRDWTSDAALITASGRLWFALLEQLGRLEVLIR